MFKKIFFTIALTLPLTAIAKSPVVFLKENPNAANTLNTPESVALCMAMNGALIEATMNGTLIGATSGEVRRKLNALNAIIWAFLEGNGSADYVAYLLPSAINKLKSSSSSIEDMLDSAGCENLNRSLAKKYLNS